MVQKRIYEDPSTSPEDIEAMAIERERQRDLNESYKSVERIIAQRIAPATIDVDHEHSTVLFLIVFESVILKDRGQSSTCASGKAYLTLKRPGKITMQLRRKLRML